MTRTGKVLTYGTGFILGCLILALIPRETPQPKRHPWHEQTALEGTYPMQVVDDAGRTVLLEKQPRHFISLAPSITEMLYAMAMGDHLMAVTQWCNYPEKARELRDAGAHIGSMDQPNRELIAAYRPDLIIGTDLTPPEIYAVVENPPGTVAVVLRHASMEDVLEDIRIIGKITGVPGKALRLVQQLEEERVAVEARLESFRQSPAKRVLVLLGIESGGQPGWAPGEDTWVNNLLESANAINVASALGREWGEVSFETLVSLNPEILLVRDGESPEAQTLLRQQVQSLSGHPVWKQVKAVQDGRVHILPHGPFNIPGPRIMQAYASIAEAVWEPHSGQSP
jgi:iron complex transport system substrate-binding protein